MKKKIENVDFDGKLEGTDIELKIHDIACQGIDMRTVNVITNDNDYLLSLKDASLGNMALAITNRKSKKTAYYVVMLKPVDFKF